MLLNNSGNHVYNSKIFGDRFETPKNTKNFKYFGKLCDIII